MNNNKKPLIIRFAEVDGTPIEKQIQRPIVIKDPESYYSIASIHCEDEIVHIRVKVENGSITSTRFEVEHDCINILFTIPENGRFFGIIPMPNIYNNAEEYWIKMDINDENAAYKYLIFVVYKK